MSKKTLRGCLPRSFKRHIRASLATKVRLNYNCSMGKIRATHYRIRLRGRGCPAGGPDAPFSIAVLADLHNRVYRASTAELIEVIRTQRVDAVFSVGDLVVAKAGRFEYDQALELFAALTAHVPVYASRGNHETRFARLEADSFRTYDEKARMLGVTFLDNAKADLVLHRVHFEIFGLELPRPYYKGSRGMKLDTAVLGEKLGTPSGDAFTVLLAHHPKYFESYADWGADLTLSGHLHGGIMRLPGIGGVIGPDPSLFPKYDYGRYEKNGREMVVSAGLGTHTINLRINNPSELVVLDFE